MTDKKKRYEELKEKYKVFNLVNKYKKILFILESPHVDELLNNAPVSGSSGKAMSKVVFDGEKTPLGVKLKQEPENKIGILNVCNIPMQRAAYINEKVQKMYGSFDENKYEEFFGVVEKLRTGTKAKYKDQNRNEMQEIILSDFKEQLNQLKEKELVIIPCGKTAEVFFEVANVKSEKWTIVEGVPHPAYGSWSKVKYADNIKEMKNKIKEF